MVGLLAADLAHNDDCIGEHSEIAHQISEHRADRRAINAIGRPQRKRAKTIDLEPQQAASSGYAGPPPTEAKLYAA